MTANQAIYLIHQTPELRKAWRELDEFQKRTVLKECETVESEEEIELIIEAVGDGQRKLF